MRNQIIFTGRLERPSDEQNKENFMHKHKHLERENKCRGYNCALNGTFVHSICVQRGMVLEKEWLADLLGIIVFFIKNSPFFRKALARKHFI